jgi:hypothetical protein
MDASEILLDMCLELQLVEKAIAALEGVARNRRPGRQSKRIARIESHPPKGSPSSPRIHQNFIEI